MATHNHTDPVAGKFGLLAVIEVFRSEMLYAASTAAANCIELLKSKGHYPYSDLEDRSPVA